MVFRPPSKKPYPGLTIWSLSAEQGASLEERRRLNGVTGFEALERQLGLKLVKEKRSIR